MQRWLEPATALGASIVIGYGLVERLLPGLIELDRSRTASGRLEQPLTYWNAEGAVAAVGLVLAIRIAGDPDRSRALRGAAAAAGVLLALGVYLTFSRGALAAVAAGLVVLIALAPQVRPQLRSGIAIVGAGAVAALVASRLPRVESLQFGQEGEPGQGLLMLATLTLLALAAAAVVMRPPGRGRNVPSLPISRPAAVLAVAGVVLLTAAVAATALEGKPQGTSPQRTVGAERLGSIDSNRYRYWAVAADSWAERPLLGLGAAGFRAEWRRERDRVDESADAHSLYIETAAELGAIGLGLLVLFIGGVAAGLVRLYRLHPGLAAGPAAGFAAWAIHAGLDWNWEMPAVTLQALLLGAAALAWSERAITEGAPASRGLRAMRTGSRDCVVPRRRFGRNRGCAAPHSSSYSSLPSPPSHRAACSPRAPATSSTSTPSRARGSRAAARAAARPAAVAARAAAAARAGSRMRGP